jgi:hypothetical protein
MYRPVPRSVAKEDQLLPKKKSTTSKTAKSGVSPQMRRLMRIARAVGIVLGGFVTLVGLMATVGFLTDTTWIRLVIALLVVVGVPAFASDRFLKRTNMRGGLGLVADIFAIVLLSIALLLVAVDVASRPLLVREGDRYARSGSRTMARVVYFLGGVSPVFPEDRAGSPAPKGSASAAVDGGAR